MNQVASLLALGVALAVLPPSSLSAGPQAPPSSIWRSPAVS